MKNIITLTKFTLREALSKKLFIFFAGISTFVLLIFILIFSLFSTSDLMGVIPQNSGKETTQIFKDAVVFFKVAIINPLFIGGLFISIFATANFIPTMLEKGSIDLLLSKPVSRSQVIWGKFVGGTLMVLINIAYFIIGFWALIGIKFGVWDASFLLSILLITFTFMVLYSLVILIGILTRSSALSIMVSYLVILILSPLLAARDRISFLIDNPVAEAFTDGLYYIVPKTSELGSITNNLVLQKSIESYQPLISSLLFMILTLALTIIIFSKKDY
jgi:ABC-type transport system involved in multi-copper enzyme maturation permease subunit